MSKPLFEIHLEDWTEIHELPGSWPLPRLREVLRLVEYDDPVADDEALDMALMALQDLEVRDASEIVLQAVFGELMSDGVRQNLADDLQDDSPWEQFAKVNAQAGIFEAVVLLQQAFPTRFGIPDAVRLRVRVQANFTEGRAELARSPTANLVLRLLAAGMDDNAVLNRLYGEELARDGFDKAGEIIWHLSTSDGSGGNGACLCEVVSSFQWLESLKDRKMWTAPG